jgi:signal transduction histidine kinase/DNA-binding response OmpR family regulator
VGDVLDVVATDAAVFFHAESGILRWAGGRMQAVTDTTARGLFACRETAFVQGRTGRLYRANGAALERISGSDAVRETTIVSVLRAASGGCEVVTKEGRRFETSGPAVKLRPLPGGPVDEPVVAAVRAPGGGLAIATERTLRLIGPHGTRHRLTQTDGSIPGEIKQLYVSERRALWVATSMGVVRVAWPDPVSLVTEPPALQSIPGSITRHDGALMLSTETGLWEATRDTVRHRAADGYVYGSLSTSAGLLAAGSDGLFVVRDEGVRYLIDEDGAYALHRSRRDASVAYATLLGGGLVRLHRRNGRWRVADRTDRVGTLVPSLAQTPDGNLWLGTGHRGILRVASPAEALETAPITRYDTTDGLPTSTFNYATQLGDSVRFPTADGLYRFAGGHFEPEPRFQPVYADGVRKSWFAEQGPDGGVWMDFGGHKLGVARGGAGDSLRWVDRPYRRVADVGDVWSIYPDEGRDSVVWFGAEGALVRYDHRLQRFGGHRQPFRTLVRGVQTRGDSLLYGGDTDASVLPAAVAYEHNRLRFQFGSTSYEQIDGPTHNWDRPRQYRWRLEGFDASWTDWTTEAHADYTGLPPGRYTLRVQSRNLYRVVGREAALSLRVLPPWYRTWWAYGLYGVLAASLLAGGVRWRTWHLRQRQEVLEETVAEQTEEVRAQRNRLEEQAERLKELDEAKNRFFANVSHEFRTPLTLIQGPVAEVRERLRRTEEDLDAESEQLAVAERNADRLRRLVDQLLALARLDAGRYELAARPVDLDAEVQRIARAFEPLAERQGLTLAVRGSDGVDGDAEPVVVDRQALEHILRNLLSNAIKFTPEEGRVEVRVSETSDTATVRVSDTGPGIPEEKQAAVFDRFTQVDAGPTADGEGLGIGLAFAADLVDRHGGTIAVDSEKGEGTTVSVRFPRGTAHLAEEDLAAPRSGDGKEPSRVGKEFLPASSAEAAAATEASSPSPETPVVLVVDDNADVRGYVRSVLEPRYAVVEAADGREGIEAARSRLPDVMLADVMMPEMDGHEMTRRLRADPETAGIPVIMLTARAEAADEVTGLQAGADDYVTKPFDADVLRARVAGLIETRKRLRWRIREELQRRRGDGMQGASEDSAPTAAPPRLVVPTGTAEEPEFVQAVRAAVEERLADPDLTVEQVAGAVATSRSTLYRRLKEHTGQTPSQFIRQVRIEHGARLLREEEGTVSEVAYAVGFNSLSYFSRQFREHLGQSPSEYVEAVG